MAGGSEASLEAQARISGVSPMAHAASAPFGRSSTYVIASVYAQCVLDLAILEGAQQKLV
jgi:hypothetical protein